ncbi:MAG: hypothetical protein ABH834_07620 [Candidatus Altiarchaeota archaeon]
MYFQELGTATGIMVVAVELVILYKLYRHSQLLEAHMKTLESSMENVLKDVEDIYNRVCGCQGKKD